jgi:hypothetical protein
LVNIGKFIKNMWLLNFVYRKKEWLGNVIVAKEGAFRSLLLFIVHLTVVDAA